MSLTSDDLADIKQLMTSVVRAEVSAEVGVLRDEINERFEETDNKIDTLASNVAKRFDEQDDKMNEILNALGADLNEHEEQIEDHERRIYRLEQKAA